MLRPCWCSQNIFTFVVISCLAIVSVLSAPTTISLQESKLVSIGQIAQQTTISTKCSSCTTTTQYGISAWVYKVNWVSGWNSVFRVSTNPASDLDVGRIILSAPNLSTSTSLLFFATTTSDQFGGWSGWKNAAEPTALLQGQWVFMSIFIDVATNTQSGIRYYLDQTSKTSNVIFQKRNTGTLRSLSPSAVVYWGGKDPFLDYCNCWMQYVRVYWDYLADTEEKLINLALMNPSGTLYRFYFTSDPSVMNNRTFIVSQKTTTMESGIAGYKGFYLFSTIQAPSFGPYNTLMCRPNQIISLPVFSSITKDGLVVAMDFYPYSNGEPIQTIFSIRNTATNSTSMRGDYFLDTGALNVWINLPTNPYYVFNSTITEGINVQTEKWTRIIFEIIQAQPLGLTVGFSSIRVWAGETVTPRVYFGDFATGDTTILDGNNAAMDVCGVFDSTSATNVSTIYAASFDVLNFMWYQGAQFLRTNTGVDGCLLGGFPESQWSCLQCDAGYFLKNSISCVTSVSDESYYLHAPTNSYQKCWYGHYYNIINGLCLRCREDGYLMMPPQCVSCPSCITDSSSPSCSSTNHPLGDSLTVTPLTGGLPLSTNFTASLSGWTSQNGGSLTYSLHYVKAPPMSPDPVRLADFSSEAEFSFYLPYTSGATIIATVRDPMNCSTYIGVNVTLNLTAQSGSDLLQTSLNFFHETPLPTAPLSVINPLSDQISIANQLILCGNELDSSICNSTQMMSCGESSSCSNHGQCSQGRCLCNQGYYLQDCSLTQSDYDLQTQLRQSLINLTLTNLNDQNILEMMTVLNALTQQPYLNTNSTLDLTLNAVAQAIQILNSSSISGANLSTHIQAIANAISNSFQQIDVLDCGLYNNFSLQALNRSYDLLEELSDIHTRSSATPLNLSSGIFDINMGPDAPQLDILSLQNQVALPPLIALTYIYLKKDPLKCNSTPPTNFTLTFKNAENLQQIYPNASILITYPQDTFKSVICPILCKQGRDSLRNTTCLCKNISIFDVKSQLGRLYRESNLHLLTISNFAKIFTSPIHLQWCFWVIIAMLIWFVATLLFVKTWNKDYCLAQRVRRSRHEKLSRSTLQKFFMYLAVVHPLLGIYFYKGMYATSKAFRALIYFVRVMTLLGTSAIFMKNPESTMDSLTFGGEMMSLDIYLIFTPMVVVLPITFIIQKALSKARPKKQNGITAIQLSGRNNKFTLQSQKKTPDAVPKLTTGKKIFTIIGVIMAILLAAGGIAAALTISILINTSQQLSWAAKFVKSVTQDLFLSPLLALGLNFIGFQCSKSGRRIKRLGRLLIADNVLELSAGFWRSSQINANTTMQTGLPQPTRRSTSTVMMNQIKRGSRPTKIHLSTTSGATARHRSTNGNLPSEINESHYQLNSSSFHESVNQSQLNQQKRLVPRRITVGAQLSRQVATHSNNTLESKVRKPRRRTQAPEGASNAL